jgi:hypothetical protein
LLDPEHRFRIQFGMDLSFIIGLEQKLAMRIAECDYPMLPSLHGCPAYLARRAGSAERPAAR